MKIGQEIHYIGYVSDYGLRVLGGTVILFDEETVCLHPMPLQYPIAHPIVFVQRSVTAETPDETKKLYAVVENHWFPNTEIQLCEKFT